MPIPPPDLDTPAALIDVARVERNVARMQRRADALGVALRPHVKTSKCAQVAALQRAAGGRGVTVSTLKEADAFLAAGERDILYAVGMAAHRLPHALDLCRRGCALKLVTDNAQAAAAIAAFGARHGHCFEVWIEVDTDGHRSGVQPGDAATLVAIARALEQGGGARLGGVMAHAGSSYEVCTPEALAAIAEQERAGCVRAAGTLRAAGFACPVVSVGSTPTALAAAHLEGVTELRAGVYVFFDLVMRNVGVCGPQDIALSVLATVIGHQPEKGWAIVDAGWMAMSRDRGTARMGQDFGYGQVCDAAGAPLAGWLVTGANQEHGIVSFDPGAAAALGAGEGAGGGMDAAEAAPAIDIAARFPIGTRLRMLPNHACATGAQFPLYHALADDGSVQAWPRLHGW